AGVERSVRRTESTQSSSQYTDGARAFLPNLDSQAAQAGQRRTAVRARGEICDRRSAVCNRGKYGVAVTNRFIAGHREPAADAACGRNSGNGKRGHGGEPTYDIRRLA